MVAKITVPVNIRRALNYNEQKVKEEKAKCIYANNFLKDAEQLNFYEKLRQFEDLISLNKRATTNTVHISLNFGLNEKLEKQKLIEIASVYMTKIGFGEQPYLVYQHFDAGHPHIHIVTTNIQQSGKRISLHNLGRNESTKARKEIEVIYNLVKAEDQKKQPDKIKPINVQRVNYGKSPTKRAITNVLDNVLANYKYASLAELNAILKLFKITADRGKEDGIIFKTNGLVYRVLDEKGNKIGVPIKASSIYSKPTLSYLQQKFKDNETKKQEYKKIIKTSIDWILLVKQPKSLQAFKEALAKEKINLVIRKNDNGIVYGLTYIDHNTKCVFNGSDIGKDYSAKQILEKCGVRQNISNEAANKKIEKSPDETLKTSDEFIKQKYPDLSGSIDAIIHPSEGYNYLPYELKKRKRRRKKNQ